MAFQDERAEMDEFARIMADAGMDIYRAESLLDGFIRKVIDEGGREPFDLEVEFRCCDGPDVPVVRFEKILWDAGLEAVVVAVEGGTRVPWDSITLGAKTMIADQVHLKLLSVDIYKNLRNQ